MRMARDGRLCKGRAADWPGIFRRLVPAEVWREFHGRAQRAGDLRTHWLAKTVVLCFALMGWVHQPGLIERFIESRAVLAALYPNRRRPGGSLQGLVKAGQRLKPGRWHCRVPLLCEQCLHFACVS